MISIKIDSIPPGVRGRQTRSRNTSKKTSFKAKGKPVYKKMSTKGLQELLKRALLLAEQMKEAVKILPSDENLLKLDKLEYTVLQLKQQIKIRSEKIK